MNALFVFFWTMEFSLPTNHVKLLLNNFIGILCSRRDISLLQNQLQFDSRFENSIMTLLMFNLFFPRINLDQCHKAFGKHDHFKMIICPQVSSLRFEISYYSFFSCGYIAKNLNSKLISSVSF